VDVHVPDMLQLIPEEQVPQEPPQPSSPQARPEQSGVHVLHVAGRVLCHNSAHPMP